MRCSCLPGAGVKAEQGSTAGEVAKGMKTEAKEEDIKGDEEQERERRRLADESAASQHSELFCALCTKRHHMLKRLMAAYAKVGLDGATATAWNLW